MRRGLTLWTLVLLVSAARAEDVVYQQSFELEYQGDDFQFFGGSFDRLIDREFRLDDAVHQAGSFSLKMTGVPGELRATHNFSQPLSDGRMSVWLLIPQHSDAVGFVSLDALGEGQLVPREAARLAFGEDGALIVRGAGTPVDPLASTYTVFPGWYEVIFERRGDVLRAYVGDLPVGAWRSNAQWTGFHLARNGPPESSIWFDEILVVTNLAPLPPEPEREPDTPTARERRRGQRWVVGAGPGFGLAKLVVSEVETEGELDVGVSFQLHAHRALHPGLQVGVSAGVWNGDLDLPDRSFPRALGWGAATARWFPDESPLVVEVGLGLARVGDGFVNDAGRVSSSNGFAFTAGTGYDFAVGEGWDTHVGFRYLRMNFDPDTSIDVFEFSAVLSRRFGSSEAAPAPLAPSR